MLFDGEFGGGVSDKMHACKIEQNNPENRMQSQVVTICGPSHGQDEHNNNTERFYALRSTASATASAKTLLYA